MNTFNANPKRFVRMSPEDYLKKRKDDPASIKAARIVPPSMDDKDDYGSFIVEMTQPRYEVEL